VKNFTNFLKFDRVIAKFPTPGYLRHGAETFSAPVIPSRTCSLHFQQVDMHWR